jgi:formylglycine-generating enzyme required for sulfatase activity
MRGRILLGASTIALLASAAPSGQSPPFDTLLESASTYVSTLVRRFSGIVGDEYYVQDLRRQGVGPSIGRIPHRELKAELLLVRLPRTMTWMPFRDVYEVDGRPVRDRKDRLSTLFVQPRASAMQQATQISEASARYNIGSMQRTVNNPMLALVFLQRDYRDRFEFSSAGPDPDAGPGVQVVKYQETARPTLVHGKRDEDMPAHGRFWIEPNGRILKTELSFEDVDVRATIVTTFAPDERFQMNVPEEMHELYTLRGGQLVATATYSGFHSFEEESRPDLSSGGHIVKDEATGLSLVAIHPGDFTMGSGWSERGRHDDEVPHEVRLEKPFYIGQFEITQAEWQAVMGSNPSRFADCGPDCPVESISFDDAQRFVAALNQHHGAYTYRLPTEAEWEYACREGGTAAFGKSTSLSTSEANYNGMLSFNGGVDYRKHPTPVGTFPPNSWGLADMHGNVLEWTADWYGTYPTGAVSDPQSPSSGDRRVVRGGSWFLDVGDARCATRGKQPPDRGSFQIGLRVAADRRNGGS